MANPLGRLASVDLRDYWKDEARDFTPWLAQPENIGLLGETLGIGLEPIELEAQVGPYRADIVANRTGSQDKVVIENQLGNTDHDHLGKVLTYAATLNATTVIWIAGKFKDEHRQAIDWLNSLATTNLQLFAVEVQLWKIGGSPLAPQFRILSQPNDYVRAMRDEGITELKGAPRFYMEFWSAFKEYVASSGSDLHLPRPTINAWLSIAIGKSNFGVNPVLSLQKRYLGCELYIGGSQAKQAFVLLEHQKEEIEAELNTLNWQALPQRNDSRIATYVEDVNLEDDENWPTHFEWLKERCEAFVKTLGPRVRNLNLTEEQQEVAQ